MLTCKASVAPFLLCPRMCLAQQEGASSKQSKKGAKQVDASYRFAKQEGASSCPEGARRCLPPFHSARQVVTPIGVGRCLLTLRSSCSARRFDLLAKKCLAYFLKQATAEVSKANFALVLTNPYPNPEGVR